MAGAGSRSFMTSAMFGGHAAADVDKHAAGIDRSVRNMQGNIHTAVVQASKRTAKAVAQGAVPDNRLTRVAAGHEDGVVKELCHEYQQSTGFILKQRDEQEERNYAEIFDPTADEPMRNWTPMFGGSARERGQDYIRLRNLTGHEFGWRKSCGALRSVVGVSRRVFLAESEHLMGRIIFPRCGSRLYFFCPQPGTQNWPHEGGRLT